MLEPSEAKVIWKTLHSGRRLFKCTCVSTHEASLSGLLRCRDDIPGADAGAGYVDEAMFAAACFYKYFPFIGNAA